MSADIRSLTLAIGAAAVLGGCATIHADSADEFLIKYMRGEQYETAVPLILMWENDGTIGRRQALVVPPDVGVLTGGRLHSAPPVSNPWGPCKSGNSCGVMGDVVAVVPARSLLTISRIEYSRGVDWWYGTHADLTPFAFMRFENGKSVEVEISDLSRFQPREVKGKTFLVPEADPEVLQQRKGDGGN